MKKNILLLNFLLILVFNAVAQVNTQAGAASYEIPVFNFSDAKSNLAHNVSLVYSSGSGFKVNDFPSGIGQGWDLICGGAIVRKQNGEADDQNSTASFPIVPYNNTRVFNQNIAAWTINYQSFEWGGDCYSRDFVDNYYPNGFLYSEFPLDLTDDWPLRAAAPRELAFFPRFRGTNDKRWKLSKRSLADREQDVFVFNINGRIGEFVIGKNGQIVTMLDSKLIIEKVETDMTALNIRTRISEFKITDEMGIIYKFNALNLSEVLWTKEVSSTDNGGFTVSISEDEALGKYTVQGWYLTSIKNPFTNEEIVFTYSEKNSDYDGPVVASYTLMEHDNFQNADIHRTRVKTKNKRLESIAFPDGHSMHINHTGLRQDLKNEEAIADISIKLNNTLVNQINFNHSYFFKKEIRPFTEIFAEADKRYLRLALTGFQNTAADGTSIPPYQFTYYTGIESSIPSEMVPPRDCLGQDNWGHYTGFFHDQPVPSYGDLKYLLKDGVYRYSPSYAVYGLLKTVKNPAGGELTYAYNSNKSLGNNPVGNPNIGGLHVNYTKTFDGIDHANDIITSYNYVAEDGSSSLWGYETPQNGLRREIKIYKDVSGYKYAGVQALVTNSSNDAASKIEKAALRRTLITKAISIAVTVGRALLASTAPTGYGLLAWAAAEVVGKIIQGIFLESDPYDYEHTNLYQFYPMNYDNPIGFHFSRVVISDNLPGGFPTHNGYIVQEFSKPVNIGTEILENNFPYSQRMRYAPWKYDQLKKEKVYNNSNFLISEKEFEYNVTSNTMTDINFLSSKVQPNYFHSSHWEALTYSLSVSNLTDQSYYPITGNSFLTSTNQKNYSATGVLSETNSSVQYNADLLPNVSTAVKSNGDQIITKTYYSNDYNSSVSAAIQLLKTKHAIAVPVATEKWLKKAVTNDEFLVEASINEFIVLPNNDIKIGKVYALENKEPVAKSIIQDWNANTLVRNTNYFKVQQEFTYNTDGNPVKTTSYGGEISSRIFDYNKRLVTASISNAAPADVAYTSFETENTGGWSYCDHCSLVVSGISETPTGGKCFSMPYNPPGGGAWISSDVNINRDYILSFWMKNGGTGPFVSGFPALLKSITVNDWTYYEYKISQGSASPSISGEGYIDELRLYPDNAKMSTVTYDPTKGKTSECDVNNRILYYEYDGLGRIVKVKDEKRNVIKTYEYHYKN